MLNQGFEVSIAVGDRRLEEYDVKRENDKTYTCFIPMLSDQMAGSFTDDVFVCSMYD